MIICYYASDAGTVGDRDKIHRRYSVLGVAVPTGIGSGQMNLGEVKELSKQLTIIRNAVREGLENLEGERPVLAFKNLARADCLLFDSLDGLAKKFPHDL